MNNEVKLTLAAEDFTTCYGILIIDEDFKIEIDQSIIPEDLLNQLKTWYNEYYPYTGMSYEELQMYNEHIQELDSIGVKLLKKIYDSGVFINLGVNSYVYFSRGINEILMELR